VLALAGPLAAQAKTARRAPAPPSPPRAVTDLVRADLGGPAGVRAAPKTLPARGFSAVNVTPDGIADWLFDPGKAGLPCARGAGCRQVIIVSKGRSRGYAVAMALE